MPMTEKEWEEFERTRGKALLRELIRAMVLSKQTPDTPIRNELVRKKVRLLVQEDEE